MRRIAFPLAVAMVSLVAPSWPRASMLLAAQVPSTAGSVAAGQGLPPGPGAEETARRCLTCHEADLITQQRLGEGGWDREITKMVRWGAQVPDAERPQILRYLTHSFGPRLVARTDAAAVAEGEAVYKAACLTCHTDDLAAQQRLSRAAWMREVDKMVRWGARVTDAQKAPLAEYLTARWGRP